MGKGRGFTLIELLIVIAILGVLATVLLVLINPLEQMARARDAGRKSTVGQLGKAVAAYYINHATQAMPYPLQPEAAAWIQPLVLAGEIKAIPNPPLVSVPTGYGPCGGLGFSFYSVENGLCYRTNCYPPEACTWEAVVYTRLESKLERDKCNDTGANPTTYFAWFSLAGRAGVICVAPAPQTLTLSTFVGE